MQTTVKIISINPVTHDVKCFRVEKPAGYEFLPGQATDVAINMPGFREKLRPFTFTSLNSDPYLEFTIKRYQDRHDVTDQLHHLKTGDELLIGDVWGAIEYKGEGYFIAGGAGITPFIAILRQLFGRNMLKGNTLFYSNKTHEDIIYREELQHMLHEHAIFTLTREKHQGLRYGRIDGAFLKEQHIDAGKQFYVCGPDQMVFDITDQLSKLGAKSDAIIFEK